MKKYFLPHEGQNFKANLHCHSTVSDGRLTVEEIKAHYMKNGYSIIAYTDHDVLVAHDDLNEEGKFLALHGYEMEVNEEGFTGLTAGDLKFGSAKTAHICLVAKSPDNMIQVCYNKDKYIWGNAQAFKPQLKFESDDYIRRYSAEGVNDMIRLGREHGFFVTYNHPAWSMESYPEYSAYEGMHAMEIWNTGCEYGGWPEYNDRCYDDLLRQGKRIFVTATDDNHNGRDLNDPLSDACGGWIVVRCAKLEYECVTDALFRGDFYASMGPEIHDLWEEDGYIHITTSPVHRISFITGARHCASSGAAYGKSLTEASFRYNRDSDGYVRVDIRDDYGRHAATNAVWMDEIEMR